MPLTMKDMSFAAEDHGLVMAYENARKKVDTMLQLAELSFSAIESKLLETLAEYDRLEDENKHRMKRIEGTL